MNHLLNVLEEWYDATRRYSPPECVSPMQKIISVSDKILLGGNETQITQLKGVFGMNASLNDTDFAATLVFQYTPYGHNWVPCLNQDDEQFCTVLSNGTLQFPELASNESDVREIIANGGWANESQTLTVSFLNFIGLTLNLLPGGDADSSADNFASLGTRGSVSLFDERASSGEPPIAHSFNYQLCTEFGYFMSSGGPQSPLPIISSLVTAEYLLEECNKLFNLTTPPMDTGDVTKYGGYNLSYPRLMIVGGEVDSVS